MPENTEKNLLTDGELELMLILWELGEGSVRDVLAALPEGRNMAYTTASTLIRIMEKKGYVKSRKSGKSHIYTPALSKETYESRTLGHMVTKLFDNTPVSLVARLIKDENLSPEELAEIRKLLTERSES